MFSTFPFYSPSSSRRIGNGKILIYLFKRFYSFKRILSVVNQLNLFFSTQLNMHKFPRFLEELQELYSAHKKTLFKTNYNLNFV